MAVETIEHRGVPLRVARPSARPSSGVVVLHQAPGYSPQTDGWLTLLADAGYLAVAPLLLHRAGVESVDPMDRFGGDVVAFAQFLPGDGETREDIAAALDFLEAEGVSATSTGLVGFSYGGRAAYLIASELELGAAVTFYGGGSHRKNYHGNDSLPALTDRASTLRTPWLGLFGEQDFMLTPGELDEWELELAKAPVETVLIRYPGAGHAFDVDAAIGPGMPSQYVAEAAEDATMRTTRFLGEKLR